VVGHDVGLVAVDFLGDGAGGGAESAGVHYSCAFVCQILSEESGVHCTIELFLGGVVQVDVEAV
jgi:hypothetical protein